jgi:hypothetical protein
LPLPECFERSSYQRTDWPGLLWARLVVALVNKLPSAGTATCLPRDPSCYRKLGQGSEKFACMSKRSCQPMIPRQDHWVGFRHRQSWW